jgi:acyl-CoA hydrolase
VFLPSLAPVITLKNQAVLRAQTAMTMALNAVHQRHVKTRQVLVAVLLPVAVHSFRKQTPVPVQEMKSNVQVIIVAWISILTQRLVLLCHG